LKVAFDENISIAMVRVFKALAKEYQFRKLGLNIEAAADYTPKPGDTDFSRRNDAPWIKRFAASGGQVIISGNAKMMSTPHERLALIEEGMIVLFFENRWNNWKFFAKCALLLHWLPIIAKHLPKAKPKTFWRIPSIWDEKGKLRSISTDDPRQLRIERRRIAVVERKAKPSRKPLQSKPARPMDLVDLMNASQNRAD
jgi:hypothetical protein